MSRSPEPTRQEIADWRRLLLEARACANNPARPTGDLFSRVAKTFKLCTPTGREERSNPWFVLREAATAFCARKSERVDLARDLSAKVEVCASLLADMQSSGLSAPGPSFRSPRVPTPSRGPAPDERPRTLRFRADLDG